MNQKELVKDIIQWDVKNWSAALAFWEQNLDLKSQRLKCLELGSRQGGLSLWLGEKGHDVVCSDIENPRHLALPVHQKYGIEGLINYEAMKAEDISYENHFDIIAFKSILGVVGVRNQNDKQEKAFDEIYKALKPGGKLLFAENLKGSLFHQYLRKKFVRWGKKWNYPTIPEFKGFLQRFSSFQYGTGGILGVLGKSEPQRNLLGSIDRAVLDKLIPENHQYIIYGIAVK